MGFEGANFGLGENWAEVPSASPLHLRHFGSCQGPDGSEGGRARGLVLRSEVLFSQGRGRGELGLDHALWLGGSPRVREGWSRFLHPGEVQEG